MKIEFESKYDEVAGGFKNFIQTTVLKTEKELIKEKSKLFDFHKKLTILVNDIDFYIQTENFKDILLEKHCKSVKERAISLLNLCHNNYIIPINQIETRKSIKLGNWSTWLGLGSVLLGLLSIFLAIYWTTRDISNNKIVSDLNTSIDITTVKLSNEIQNQEKLIVEINRKLNSTLTNNLKLNKKIVMLEKDIKATKSVANKGYKSLSNK
jgi:hypothetical protein